MSVNIIKKQTEPSFTRILPPRKIERIIMPVSAARYNALVEEYNELVEDIDMLIVDGA